MIIFAGLTMSTTPSTDSGGPDRKQNGCYHCGADCRVAPVRFDGKVFCCQGCRTVYEILSQGNACDYYRYEAHPGMKADNLEIGSRYAYLDHPDIAREMLDFYDDGIGKVRLYISAIHCSSCIWLLENLQKLHPGVVASTVNFGKKEVSVTFRESRISLRKLVELLVSIGYVPELERQRTAGKPRVNHGVYYRLGVAGFCFGNIMLFSFPAYLSVNDAVENLLRQNFGLLNILFGIPVAFYSGSVFITSAWKGLRRGFISIDLPIAVGILILFFRSFYEILSGTGPGFMDSLAGLVFFLSIGRWYQDKTYQALSFERDFRSYFPVAVTLLSDSGEESILPLRDLKPGMRILVRSRELVPADALLVAGEGSIDYSFVSGEASPVPKKAGDRVFAGGRQTGASIELIVEREVTQGHLTSLWNQDAGGPAGKPGWDSVLDVISRYFTWIVLGISLISGITWWFVDRSQAFLVVTAVLIVACPCALAMTYPFSLGGTMRIFGRNNFYLKRLNVVEKLSKMDTIVLDKTGTITRNDLPVADFSSLLADAYECRLIASLARQSTHPASVAVYRHLQAGEMIAVSGFRESASEGAEGLVDGHTVRIGSARFVAGETNTVAQGTRVHVSIDGRSCGHVAIRNHYREGMKEVLTELAQRYELHLLSGDNDAERDNLQAFFPSAKHLNFNQSPADKLEYVRRLRASGKKVIMIGDGLNDAGALRESDCGITIADDVYHFSPACDAILGSEQFRKLPAFLKFTRTAMRIVTGSIGLSFLYNVIGLSFAVSGHLSPVVSAILMPLSSVSVVALVSLSVYLAARLAGFSGNSSI